MKIKPNYKLRQIAGENVVMMNSKEQTDLTHIISLNDSSALLWTQLGYKDFTAEDVVQILCENFEVERSVAELDARAWIDSLIQHGICE